jgi:4-amino-4-deoxy-L-arabinose transferase-like glycosyltransferase
VAWPMHRRLAPTSLIQQLVIVLAAAAMFLANLGASGLWDNDETIYATIAREMAVRGDWIVPTFNGVLFPEKPPLMFWLMMGSFKVLGASEFAARLPAAVLAIGTALATYHLARRLFSVNVGFWAGLIVSSNVIFAVSARAATVDSALTLLTALVMLLFVKGTRLGDDCRVGQDRVAGAGPALNTVCKVPNWWLTFAAIGALLGLAILAKGPIGFLLPAASLGLFLLVMNRQLAGDGPGGPSYARRAFNRLAATFSPRQVLRVVWSMRPLTVLAVAAIVALPWFVAVSVATKGEWLDLFVTKYNLGPFMAPFLGHRGSIFYHFLFVLVGFFPWSIFLGPTVVNAWRAVRAGGREAPSYVFMLCWIGVFFGFWSVCSTKLPHYILPAYPALAILTACFLDGWLQRSEAAPRFIVPIATASFLAVGAIMLAALPWVAARYVPGEEVIALVGLPLVLGGAAAAGFLARGWRPAYLAAIAASSVLFIVALFAWAALRIDRHQHARPLLAALHGDSPAAPQIASYKYCIPSIVYYAGEPVAKINDAAQLNRFVEQSSHPYVITTEDGLSDLESQMHGRWRVVARRARFLDKGEVVVLAPPAAPTELTFRDDTPGRSGGGSFRK